MRIEPRSARRGGRKPCGRHRARNRRGFPSMDPMRIGWDVDTSAPKRGPGRSAPVLPGWEPGATLMPRKVCSIGAANRYGSLLKGERHESIETRLCRWRWQATRSRIARPNSYRLASYSGMPRAAESATRPPPTPVQVPPILPRSVRQRSAGDTGNGQRVDAGQQSQTCRRHLAGRRPDSAKTPSPLVRAPYRGLADLPESSLGR